MKLRFRLSLAELSMERATFAMRATSENLAVFVLGMHRSGTSALTRVLSLCELGLPSNLIAASETNARGFWESPAVNALNNAILERSGQTWFNIEPLSDFSKESEAASTFIAEARRIINTEFSSADRIVIKDPRICRLVAFWKLVTKVDQRAAVFPTIVRNPNEVSASLEKRNGFERRFGQLLWLRYYLDAEFSTRYGRRCFLSYADLITNWRNTVTRIESELNISLPVSDYAAQEVDEFLSADLRHNHSVDNAIPNEMPWVSDVYSIFLSWIEGSNPTKAQYSALDRIRREFDRLAPVIAPLVEGSRQNQKRYNLLTSQTQNIERELNKAREALQCLNEIEEDTKKNLVSVNKISTVLRQEQKEQENFRSTFERVTADLSEAVQRAVQTVDLLNASSESSVASIDSRLVNLAKQQGELVQYQEIGRAQMANIASLLDSEYAKAISDAAIARETQRLVEERLQEAHQTQLKSNEVIAEMRANIEKRDRTISNLEAKVEAANEQLRSLEDENRQLNQEWTNTREGAARSDIFIKELNVRLTQTEQSIGLLESKYKSSRRKLVHAQLTSESVRRELTLSQAELQRLRNLRVVGAQEKIGHIRQTLVKKSKSVRNLFRGFDLGAKTRLSAKINEVRATGAFDEAWYLSTYTDVANAKIDPILHYLSYGWIEGRDPSPDFSTRDYLRNNPDVFAAGVNPFTHYLQFGIAEGRKETAHIQEFRPDAVFEFGLAHPCYSMHIDDTNLAVPTGLSNELKENLNFSFLSTNWDRSDTHSTTFELFKALSGGRSGADMSSELVVSAKSGDDTQNAPAILVDAWSIGRILKMRWHIKAGHDTPLDFFAYQLDHSNQQLVLVGSGRILDGLDVLALTTLCRFRPVLIVGVDVDGDGSFVRLLPFPSLLRGGLHYPEALSVAEDFKCVPSAPGIDAQHVFAEQYCRITNECHSPLIAKVVVKIRGADGTEPIFDPQFLDWMQRAFRINVTADRSEPEIDTPGEKYLTELLNCQNAGSNFRPTSAHTLNIDADAIPSLSALTAVQHADTSDTGRKLEATNIVFAVTGDDPSSQKHVVRVPVGTKLMSGDRAQSGLPEIPSIVGEHFAFSGPEFLIAVTQRERPALSAAELLVPSVCRVSSSCDSATKIAAVFDLSRWDTPELLLCIESMALQQLSSRLHILIFTSPKFDDLDPLKIIIERFFPNQVRYLEFFPQSWGDLGCDFIVSFQPGLTFHDPRTLDVLHSLLFDTKALSSTCPIVHAKESRRHDSVEVVWSSAVIVEDFNRTAVLQQMNFLSEFKGTAFPVATANPYLWMANCKRLDNLGVPTLVLVDDLAQLPPSSLGRRHLVSTLASASIATPRDFSAQVRTASSDMLQSSTYIRTLHG